ncbi:hypothetical protein BDF14DRAFT_1870144 [Spinellus fusiger]|nr:hypothetical protein BDF14DRAFT_1870144 [Spinellus fusiger]
MTITPLTRKQKYFYYTCINGIVDVSTMCRLAFLKSVPKQMTEIIIKDLTSVNTAKFADYNLQCGSSLKQVNNNYSLKNTITSIDNFTPSNEIEECVKEIYLFILKLHYRKPFSFYQERIELYSEEDYVVKFWANVFESFFGSNEHLFLHWGDTQAKACKNNGLSMKLDMRIMIMKNGKHVVEGGTCEYAKNPVRSKYFRDRLKLVLASKAYINNVIENSPYLAEEDIKNIKIPLIQIMGFEAQLSTISVKEKGIYAVEDLLKFSFPTSKKQIRQGGINNIIKALSLIQHLIHELEELLEEGKVDREGGKMTSISNETSHKKNKAKDWIDEVVCPANTDNSEEDGDKEDED